MTNVTYRQSSPTAPGSTTTKNAPLTNAEIDGNLASIVASVDAKQTALVSGTSIKTINGASVLSSGNLALQTVLVSGTDIKTVNGGTLLGSGNIALQTALVSGTDIKTINSTSLLGSGDLALQANLVSGTDIKTINSTSLLGSGDLALQANLVSGTNIKTINGNSLLGSGNLVTPVGNVNSAVAEVVGNTGKLLTNNGTNNLWTDTKTVGGSSIVGTGDIPMMAPFRNRIINGDMRIDRRNNGAEINPAVQSSYYLDRWYFSGSVASKMKIGRNAGAVTPPAGFANYLGVTSISAHSMGAGDFFAVRQNVEGYNIADLAWGTASAKSVTLSFKVRSSLTGTFGGSIHNNDGSRTYVFTYSVPVANVWTDISITIPGDISGTWLASEGTGAALVFGLGVGSTFGGTVGSWSSGFYLGATGATSVVSTNGATFYVTGVQLEPGSSATTFEQRPYAVELSLCQRYLPPLAGGAGVFYSTVNAYVSQTFGVTSRIAPTGLVVTANGVVIVSGSGTAVTNTAFLVATTQGAAYRVDIASGGIPNAGATCYQSIGYYTGCEL
jgi:hypothetical protein